MTDKNLQNSSDENDTNDNIGPKRNKLNEDEIIVLSDENNSGKSGISESEASSVEYNDRKTVKITRIWKLDQTIDTIEEVSDFFQTNNFWKRLSTSKLNNSTKTYYYCNIRGRINKCPAQLNVLKKNSTTDYVFFKSDEHNHEELRPSKNVSVQVRNRIAELYKQGLTQRLISHALRDDANVQFAPKEIQVSEPNYIDTFAKF